MIIDISLDVESCEEQNGGNGFLMGATAKLWAFSIPVSGLVKERYVIKSQLAGWINSYTPIINGYMMRT